MNTTAPVNGVSNPYEYQPIPRLAKDQGGQEGRTGKPGVDTAQFSPEALRQAKELPDQAGSNGETSGLTPDEEQEVRKLKQRDQEVHIHEQAHMAAGGSLIRRGAAYEYRTGPDGKRYAAAGEVSIDTAPVEGDPRATARKAQQIRKAAMAPAQPSGQDQAVAAAAAAMEMKALQELAQQNRNPQSSTVDKAA